jgi:hypothetical protein
MADDAVDNADDAAAPATTANDAALPRSIPSIKEADGGKEGDDDAPITLILMRFIQNFCLRIDGPIAVAIFVVRRRGGHEPEVPRGGANGDGKRLGAVVLLSPYPSF